MFGRFDLDPCAPRKTRTRVHLTVDDDGLSVAWHGVVFVNPPYGRGLAAWVAKAHGEVEAGRAAVFFLRGRLRFGAGTQSAPFPSALVVWGATSEELAVLGSTLPNAWRAG